jgi:cytochrome c peroxidase
MNLRKSPMIYSTAILLMLGAWCVSAADKNVFEPGHPSLRGWLLPSKWTYPEGNEPTPDRVSLGKKLFFDPKLSGDGDMSCGTCHKPENGWSDGLPTARGHKGLVLSRSTPTIINTKFNDIMMWDGRKATLEDQALGPMESRSEMNTDLPKMFRTLSADPDYTAMFQKAYPNKPINGDTVSMAIASFERTVVNSGSPFDRWVNGERDAMNQQQVRGFKLFVGKARCDVCHAAPNFTNSSFHNVGLASYGSVEPDLGRFAIKPVSALRGAFKTPTLRDIELTAPYFHDGSAKTLMTVVEHYNKGGVVKSNLSKDIKPLNLSKSEKEDLVAFLRALTSPQNRPEQHAVAITSDRNGN